MPITMVNKDGKVCSVDKYQIPVMEDAGWKLTGAGEKADAEPEPEESEEDSEE